MFKEINLIGVKGKVKVNSDGTEIVYNDKVVNQYHLKSKKHTKGYMCCSIEGKQFYVHRLVAEGWVKNTHPLTQKLVLHKDCDTMNNNHKNLSWGDTKKLHHNRIMSNIPGAGVNANLLAYRGSSTISYDEAIKVAARLDNGETARNIAKEYDVSEMSIIRIRKRYCKNKVASPRYSNDVKKIVVQLKQKHSYKRVAEITGIRYETVIKWCKNAEPVN
ncbi:MAG: helix-turn-helix domain-containing protein [Bacteroidales bacterium]|nr:helix-turn-helix domain-containing protein [Bacteroidales bacterium]MBN2819517.1 helix-turn-helix domain-containing protein [Bacteroidales bacterium]